MYELKELLTTLECTAVVKQELQEVLYKDVIFHDQSARLELCLVSKKAIRVDVYEALLHSLRMYTRSAIELKIELQTKDYSFSELSSYVKYCGQKSPALLVFQEVYPSYEHQTLVYKFNHSTSYEKALHSKLALQQELHYYGLQVQVDVEMLKEKKKDETQVKKSFVPDKVVAPMVNEVQQYKVKQKQSLDQFVPFLIEEITEECHGIKVEGEIFEIETRTIAKTGKDIQTIYLKDATSAIVMKRFERGAITKEVLAEFQIGDVVRVYGKVEFDMFSKELVVMPDALEKLEKKVRKDHAKVKRVEFHTHSKYSEMDGVSSVQEYISTAAKWGMDALAITDHAVVQSFPKAQGVMSKINKGRETPFKVIYGCEMNMVNDTLEIVKNVNDANLDDITYCILDIESTGLSAQHDYMTEFGAVIMKGKSLTEEKIQFLVQCPVPLTAEITKLTKITDQELRTQGIPIHEAVERMLAFIKDATIVAHNANFDVPFINAILKRCGKEPLTNPVIDTLDLSRSIHFERKYHKLSNIASLYNIAYDSDSGHRADYDAEVLAAVFLKMRQNELKEIHTLKELSLLQPERAFVKNREQHVTVYAKNQEGLKELFELISISHTTYLSYLNKNSNTIIATPKILKSVLEKYHESGNLVFGSSCSNGEIFDLAKLKEDFEVENAMNFYDVIELQPIKNYYNLINQEEPQSYERLIKIVQTIYRLAKKKNKIIIASSDAHYVHPEDAMIREIYINSMGIGGVRHPLFVRGDKADKYKVNEAHLRTTDEMLEEFPYLTKDQTYEIVVENTRALADSFDFVYPVKDKLYPPEIEGCADTLRDLCYENAHLMYGKTLPEIVEKRLEKELKSIIGNGFQVVYYISHLLVKKSLDDGYLVGSRGSVGSSFVATMSNITEVNPLAPHYICSHCQYHEFFENGEVASGFDLPTIPCPTCGTLMRGDGQDIPFETFLGFEGDKVPDIDLNFSGEYQEHAHNYTKEVFGEEFVYRAGTIGTVAQTTAFGYVRGFYELKRDNMAVSKAQMMRLSKGCEGVKRTTGQHPGGIIVIPNYMNVHDFTPYQFPANNPNAEWKTTHFEFHDIHDNVLKLDILGHVDPTAMKLLERMSGIDPKTIPLNDPEVMAIFSGINTLKIDVARCAEKTGAAGIPEFGTQFVRNILELTKPTTFDELVRISGLSHGTDVWLNNAKDLIDAGTCTLKEVIGCRDDIMVYLMHKGLPPKTAFDIMEFVRKGKGLKEEWIPIMKEYNVEDWYIESCRKIKYMFPKAHAVAYVLMAVRIAWFKVHYPQYYYAVYFSIRCDAFDIEAMIQGEQAIREKMSQLRKKMDSMETKNDVTKKEKDVYSCLELALEMHLRGYYFHNIDVYQSDATIFQVDPNNPHYIRPPFTSIDGLGEAVAKSILQARVDEQGEQKTFISKQDLLNRTSLSKTHMEVLNKMKVLEDFQDENQMSLF